MRNDLADMDRVVLAMKGCVSDVLPSFALTRFEIGVSEALANVILHAKASDPAAPITIEVAETGAAVRVDIFDPVGAAYHDPSAHPGDLDTLDPRAESGRGIGLILHSADHVDYRPRAGRMCLSLTFSTSKD